MKIFISYPPLRDIKGTPLLGQNRQYQVFHNPTFIYPLVPASAATLLKTKGYQVLWNDCIAQRWDYQRFLQFIKQEKPDLIAIETKTPVVKQHWQIINQLKNASTINYKLSTVLMGDHVSALPEESMQNSAVDFVLTGGDYDFSLLSIAEHLDRDRPLAAGIYYRDNGLIKNSGNFQLNPDLDQLPFIDRDLTKWRLYGEKLYKRTPFAYTMAGRDCPWARCTFCSWTTLYPYFRVRSPENLLGEIGLLLKKYKVREIFDDTGTFPSGGWLDRFCRGMIARGFNKKLLFSCNFRFDYLNKERLKLMKQAGFRLFKLGLESANQGTLDRLNKNVRVEQFEQGCRMAKQAGLEVHLTIMLGYPWETRADALNTVNMAMNLMKRGLADMLQATVVVPYPGTPLYQESLKNNWFRFAHTQYQRYDMQEPVLESADIAPQEVMALTDKVYSSFLQPLFMARYLKKIRSFSDIKYILRGLKALAGHRLDFKRGLNEKR